MQVFEFSFSRLFGYIRSRKKSLNQRRVAVNRMDLLMRKVLSIIVM